jgi:hypothetical protein
MAYLGNVKPTETTSSVLRSTYTGDGSTTTFNLPGPVANETSIIATINGVTQQDAAYTTNGSQIIFSAAPSNGDAIEIRTISDVGMSYAPSTGSVTTGILADGAVTTGKINDAAVTTAKLGVGAAVANIGARAITAAQVPAGSVIQVVNHRNSTANSTTSSSYVATNSTATITPTSTTSKILIITNAPLYSNADNGHIYTSIFRGTTNLKEGNAELQLFSAGTAGTGRWTNGSMSFVDSPSTTSAVTYTAYFRASVAGTAYYDANGGMAVITLMEIAG